MVSPVLMLSDPASNLTLDDKIRAGLELLEGETTKQQLIDDIVKKQRKIKDLLIEVVIQNMTNPGGDHSGILKEIGNVLDSIRTEINLFQTVKNFVAIANSEPQSWNASVWEEVKDFENQVWNLQSQLLNLD